MLVSTEAILRPFCDGVQPKEHFFQAFSSNCVDLYLLEFMNIVSSGKRLC